MYNNFMESLRKIATVSSKLSQKPKINPHLHSPAHLLADELCNRLNDKKHFGFYLKMAMLYDHNILRQFAGQVLESKNVKSRGKLFAFLIKKSNQEKKSPSPSPLPQGERGG
jgi:hypothetical protein